MSESGTIASITGRKAPPGWASKVAAAIDAAEAQATAVLNANLNSLQVAHQQSAYVAAADFVRNLSDSDIRLMALFEANSDLQWTPITNAVYDPPAQSEQRRILNTYASTRFAAGLPFGGAVHASALLIELVYAAQRDFVKVYREARVTAEQAQAAAELEAGRLAGIEQQIAPLEDEILRLGGELAAAKETETKAVQDAEFLRTLWAQDNQPPKPAAKPKPAKAAA